jgi:FPC/CPF motif-containing protein YcgG
MTVMNLSYPAIPDGFPIRAKFDDQILPNCTIGRIPPWGAPYAEDLVRSILSSHEPFPCTFAVAAAKKEYLRFGFIENLHNNDTWWPLLDILSDYLKVYQKISRDTSLVIFFPPGEKILNMAEYYQKFWEILQFLHDNDTEEWPASVPCQVDDEWWEFSFGGVPIFAVCSTPVHDRRKSRSGPTFLITFQPRWVFEGLEADTPRGATARRVIRERLRVYDDVEPSPELGAYGNTGNREWKQYFLPDENQGPSPRCPFRHRGKPVAATEQSSSAP